MACESYYVSTEKMYGDDVEITCSFCEARYMGDRLCYMIIREFTEIG